jgi:copper(I)-binding protein
VGNETVNRAGLLRRLGTAVSCGAAAVLLVTGCAAGQQAQTVEQTPSIDGVQAEAGTIAIRAAGIATPKSGASYAKGAEAPLRMVIVNRGTAADKLVSVTSPAAGGVTFSAGASSSSATSGASPAVSTPAGTASSSASGSAPASGSASSSPGASQNTPIELPARQAVQIGFGSGGPSVVLTGLTSELFPAQPAPVTLTFSSGASVTVVLAVQLSSEAPTAPTVSEAVQPAGE